MFEIARLSETPHPNSNFSVAKPLIREWASRRPPRPRPRPVRSSKPTLYRPLHSTTEIRVLAIFPSPDPSAPIRCKLIHCDLAWELPDGDWPTTGTYYALDSSDLTRPISYTALSYTWGPPVFTRTIYVVGGDKEEDDDDDDESSSTHEKKVTESLFLALQSFRSRDGDPVVMWVDQICINQDDDDEKDVQVRLMSRVYSFAASTVIWLGAVPPGQGSKEEEQKVGAAFELLENLAERFEMMPDRNIDCPGDFERLYLPLPREDGGDDAWGAVWRLLNRPWFQRLWVMQEVILSPFSPWVACGGRLMEWDMLAGACLAMEACGIARWMTERFAPDDGKMGNNNNSSSSSSSIGAFARIKNLATNRWAIIGSASPLNLILDARNSLCYDARDKVYGMLGLFDGDWVRVSYAKDYTADMLYRDVVAHILEFGHYPSRWLSTVLSAVDDDRPIDSGLPSWVPDLKLSRTTETSLYSGGDGVYRVRGEGGVNLDPQLEIRDNELRVLGVVFDKVVAVTNVFTNPDVSYDKQELCGNNDWLASIEFATKLTSYPGGETPFAAFWQTMVAGKDGLGQNKSPAAFEEIFSLLLDETTGKPSSIVGQTYSVRQRRPRGKGKLELDSLRSRVPGKNFLEIKTALRRAVRNRRLCITEKGYLGLVPSYTKIGDVVAALSGCDLPFILRGATHGLQESVYRFVGECYVHGIMRGEAVELHEPFKECITIV